MRLRAQSAVLQQRHLCRALCRRVPQLCSGAPKAPGFYVGVSGRGTLGAVDRTAGHACCSPRDLDAGLLALAAECHTRLPARDHGGPGILRSDLLRRPAVRYDKFIPNPRSRPPMAAVEKRTVSLP